MTDHLGQSGVSPRQAAVIDWFRGVYLGRVWPTCIPVDPAIVLADAWFHPDEVLTETGLYASRRQCREELERLRQRGALLRMGQRFKYRPSTWTGVQFT